LQRLASVPAAPCQSISKGLSCLSTCCIGKKVDGDSNVSFNEGTPTTVYVDDKGDDKNDGLTEMTAVYSIRRAIEVAVRNGANNLNLQRASKERLAKKLLDKTKN